MRLTVALLGWALDVSLEPAESGEANSLDGGTTASYPVGFAQHVAPEEAPMPQRTPAWDEPEELGR